VDQGFRTEQVFKDCIHVPRFEVLGVVLNVFCI